MEFNPFTGEGGSTIKPSFEFEFAQRVFNLTFIY